MVAGGEISGLTASRIVQFGKAAWLGWVAKAPKTVTTEGKWIYGAFKSEAKWANQFAKRGWTPEQVSEAILKGKQFDSVNMVNKANSATRYVHPTTGRSVVIDNVTRELLQVGGDGFLW